MLTPVWAIGARRLFPRVMCPPRTASSTGLLSGPALHTRLSLIKALLLPRFALRCRPIGQDKNKSVLARRSAVDGTPGGGTAAARCG